MLSYTSLDPQEVTVRNMRNIAEKLSLDVQGFEYHDRPTKLTRGDFFDEEKIKSQYYPEIIKLLEEA